MKLLPVLRTLDDLAEILIFDHVLATKLRRRLVSTAVSTLMLAAYVSSGFWMAPSSTFTAPPAVVPFERASLPPAHVDLAAEIVRTRTITLEQADALQHALAQNRHELDRYLSIVGDPYVVLDLVCQRNGAARVSGVATLLCARGLYMARAGLDSSAVMDWLAVLRIGNALTHGEPSRSTDLAAHVMGGVLENTAVRLLTEHARTRGLEPVDALEIVRTLSARTPLAFSVGYRLKRESQELATMLGVWAATNQLPQGYRGLRFYLPVVQSSRRKVAEMMTEKLDRALLGLAAHAQDGTIPPRPDCRVSHVGGWAIHLTDGAGWSERFATLWSNERAADVAARLILCWRSTRLEDYAQSCLRLDREAEELLSYCEIETLSI